MSMFHELMMRKKEQTMYATIKGSLTDNNGVFSGFSASDYLKIQNLGEKISTANKWEFITKIHTTLTNSGQCILGNNVEWGTNVRINSENQLIFNVSNITTSADIGSITGTTVLSDDTDYYVKAEFTGTQYILSLSIDGTAWSNEGYINSPTKIINRGDWLYGMYSVSAWYFRGSIDLNYSYIKLGATKYKLQAVVGYTVVGSPTESPSGVFSGFSSSDYLTLPNLNFTSNNTEIVIKFTTGATISNQLVLNAGSNQLYTSSSSRLAFKISYGGNKWLTGTSTIQTNTTYYAKFINTSDGCSLYLSTDNINWNLEGKTTAFYITSNNVVYIGSGNASYTSWSGSIDLNSTYIKINNKLWFNGQEG